jgi:hypothetical protein
MTQYLNMYHLRMFSYIILLSHPRNNLTHTIYNWISIIVPNISFIVTQSRHVVALTLFSFSSNIEQSIPTLDPAFFLVFHDTDIFVDSRSWRTTYNLDLSDYFLMLDSGQTVLARLLHCILPIASNCKVHKISLSHYLSQWFWSLCTCHISGL